MRWLKFPFSRERRSGDGCVSAGREVEHLADEQILMESDAELDAEQGRHVREHLAACWVCRARRLQLDQTIGEFVDAHRDSMDSRLPQLSAPMALFKKRLQEEVVVSNGLTSARIVKSNWALAVGCALLAITIYTGANLLKPVKRTPWQTASLVIPNAELTPGAAVRLTSGQVCQKRAENNRVVPTDLQRRVFAEYGIAGAEGRAYEVDYLITPALGGADDIHNMWPQTYSAVWNARVKDALEERLRQMVCAGDLELSMAQTEISNDWIGAYKKYFHTDEPIETP